MDSVRITMNTHAMSNDETWQLSYIPWHLPLNNIITRLISNALEVGSYFTCNMLGLQLAINLFNKL